MALLPYQKLSADQMVTFSDCVWHSFLKAQGWVGQGHVHSPETSVTRGKPGFDMDPGDAESAHACAASILTHRAIAWPLDSFITANLPEVLDSGFREQESILT